MKQKLASTAKRDVVNLASSGARTALADQWQKDVITRHADEILRRAAESHPFGLESLKRAIRAAFGVPATREIVVTSGASGGIRLICEILLAGKTDAEVLIESPVYEPLRAVPERLGATVVPVDRCNDFDSFMDSVTDRTVAVFLSNLHNPTGHWLTYDSLRQACSALEAVASPAVIVVDETFLDLGPLPGTTSATIDPRIITISSLSKSHGLPSLRCGWLTADPATLPEIVEDAVLFQNIGFHLAEILGAMAVERLSEFREAARRHVAQNQAVVSQWLTDMAAAKVTARQDAPSGCIVFPRVLDCESTLSLSEKLEEAFGVLVAPGRFFGDAYDAHIRIGFGGNGDDLTKGLSRLSEGLLTLRRRMA
jgi:aspartate/methionine/tyrosine aminotransferase